MRAPGRRAQRAMDSPRYRWTVLGLTMVGIASTSFPVTVLSASLPEIAESLNTTESAVSWVQTAPLIALAVGTPLAGKLGDLYGHRRSYLWGFAGATALSLATAAAWDVGSLVALRTLGQLTGAATSPAALAVIMTVFARRERSVALGYWSAVTAMSPAIGVAVGGFMVDAFGWRTIFLMQTVPSLVALLAAIPLLPDTVHKKDVRFDVAGAASLGVAVTGALLAVNRGPAWGWDHPLVLAGLVVAPTVGGLFVFIERHASEPLLPLEFLRRRGFVVAHMVTAVASMAYLGTLVVAPFLLERSFGIVEASTRSAALVARPVGFSVGAWYAGRVESRVGGRTVLVVGTLCMALALAATGGAILAGWLAAVLALLFVAGLGQGAIRPAVLVAVGNSVEDTDLGVASGSLQMIGQIGAATGITIMISMLGSSDSATRFFVIFALAAGIAAAASLIAAVLYPTRQEEWKGTAGEVSPRGAGHRSPR